METARELPVANERRLMIFDTVEDPLSEDELVATRQEAREVLRLWRMRAIYSTAAFVLSCASVTPFLYGHSLHAYWESLGKYLVLLSMGLLIPFGICTGIAINSWLYLRDVMKGTK